MDGNEGQNNVQYTLLRHRRIFRCDPVYCSEALWQSGNHKIEKIDTFKIKGSVILLQNSGLTKIDR